MGSTEKFCLRWNDFESNISVAFRDLREEKDFFDVTLACDDSQLQAHKVILSACSPFFRNILKRNPHQHPLLYLKGVKYAELEAVLNFMYMGEVNVAQEALNSFLSVAEELRVKGLTQNNTESATAKSDKPPRLRDQPPDREAGAPPAKKSRPSQPLQTAPLPAPPTSSSRLHHEASDDDIQEVVPVKAEPRDTPVVASQQAASNQYQEESSGTAVALQDNYQDDGYDYEGYSEGYDDSSYDQTLQAGPDGNKGLKTTPPPRLGYRDDADLAEQAAPPGKPPATTAEPICNVRTSFGAETPIPAVGKSMPDDSHNSVSSYSSSPGHNVLIKEEVDLDPVVLPGEENDSGEEEGVVRWDVEMESRISLDHNLFVCMACSGSKYSSKEKLNVISHIKAKHLGGFQGFICELCPQVFNAAKRFERHMRKYHNVLTVSIDVVKSEDSITE